MKVKLRKWWIASGVLVVLMALALLGPFVYLWLSDEPPALVSQRIVNDGVITASELDGVWRIGAGSIVGYRVEEKIALADLTAVGRTSGVTGEFTVVNGVLDTAEFIVDMDTFVSDRSQRDAQFSHQNHGCRHLSNLDVPAYRAGDGAGVDRRGDDGPVRCHRRAHFARAARNPSCSTSMPSSPIAVSG